MIEQIGIKEDEFIMWSSKTKINVVLPPLLYQGKEEQKEAADHIASGEKDALKKSTSLKRSGSTMGKKSKEDTAPAGRTVLTEKDVKVMITTNSLYIFFLDEMV